MTVNAGCKIESVSIGGREYWGPDGQIGRPLAELADDDGPVVLTFSLRNNADLRRFEWRLRHDARRARRRKPHPSRVGRVLKATLRAAAAPFDGQQLTDENRESIKAALVGAAATTLAAFGIAGFTPTAYLLPPPAPLGMEIEMQFGFMHKEPSSCP